MVGEATRINGHIGFDNLTPESLVTGLHDMIGVFLVIGVYGNIGTEDVTMVLLITGKCDDIGVSPHL